MPSVDGPTPEEGAAIRRLLLAAYDAGRRDLPWRGETDPYRVWVSEVMLQQTRVETVVSYYRRWVERFPDLAVLAGAGEEEVLWAWQGMGYYTRARNLLWAARVVMERHGGELPRSAAALRRLPGVGEYTAGAVASIAFGEAVPAVDGNVRRVLSRLFDIADLPARALRELARALMDPERPGDFNQALMELGATVCVPRCPACLSCPLEGVCRARARGTVGERPARKPRPAVPTVEMAVAVAAWMEPWADEPPDALGDADRCGARAVPGVHDPAGARMRFLLRRRPRRGLLAGMWEFPGDEVGAGEEAVEAAERVLRSLGVSAGHPSQGPVARGLSLELPTVAHAFSHLRVRYRPFLFLSSGDAGGAEDRAPGAEHTVGPAVGSGVWVEEHEVGAWLPLPVAQRKILAAAARAVHEIRRRRSFQPGEGPA